MKKTIMSIAGLIGFTIMASAQLLQAQSELYKVNAAFDSSVYVGFNVTITYNSDTVHGKFAYEALSGRYILNNRNLYYRMGENEYIQNDSFVYDIDHEQKVMMMTKNAISSSSNLFPMREFLDSVLTWYGTSYDITIQDSASQRSILFTATDDTLTYQRFVLFYDTVSYYPARYIVEFRSDLDETDSVFLTRDTTAKTYFVKKPLKRRIVMQFTEYFFPESLDIFLDEQYVYFNRQTRRYDTSEKYSGYRLYTNGVEEDPEPDTTVELFPPPEEDPL